MPSAADGPGVSDQVAGGLAAAAELDDSELDLFFDPTPADGPLITVPTMSPAPCSAGSCTCTCFCQGRDEPPAGADTAL